MCQTCLAGRPITRTCLYQNWINSNAIQRRAALLTSFINGFTQGTLSIKFDPIAYVQQFPNTTIQDPDLLIDAIIPQLFAVDLPAQYKTDTKVSTLFSGAGNQQLLDDSME